MLPPHELPRRGGNSDLAAQVAAEALDDAGAALTIARQCGYAWAERDALQVKADALARPATRMALTRRGARRRR